MRYERRPSPHLKRALALLAAGLPHFDITGIDANGLKRGLQNRPPTALRCRQQMYIAFRLPGIGPAHPQELTTGDGRAAFLGSIAVTHSWMRGGWKTRRQKHAQPRPCRCQRPSEAQSTRCRSSTTGPAAAPGNPISPIEQAGPTAAQAWFLYR